MGPARWLLWKGTCHQGWRPESYPTWQRREMTPLPQAVLWPPYMSCDTRMPRQNGCKKKTPHGGHCGLSLHMLRVWLITAFRLMSYSLFKQTSMDCSHFADGLHSYCIRGILIPSLRWVFKTSHHPSGQEIPTFCFLRCSPKSPCFPWEMLTGFHTEDGF